jgi:predicted ester cyclase
MDEVAAPEVLAHFEMGEDVRVTPDRWRDAITGWREAFPDIRHVVDHLVAEGDTVAAHVHFTGTHRGVYHDGDLGPLKPTGRSVDVREMNFFRLVEGRVVEVWIVWDRIAFARQLGVDLSQAGAPA